jgi:hypothetical protein
MDRDDADEALVRAAREGGGDDELAAPLHEMRGELIAPASPQSRWNHLAAMRRAAAEQAGELPGAAAADVPVEATVATEVPRRRSHRAVALVAAATVGVLGVTGGLAAAGRLPRPAQDRVADLAEVVGIDLPDHDNAREIGPGNGREILRPTSPTNGASGVAPAVGPRGPGATGTQPGSSGSAPGHSSTDRGRSEEAPGHSKGTPGDTGTTPPGQSGEQPGSGNPPGQDGDGNGNAGTGNGNAGNPPGQTGSNGNGNSGSPPGQTGSNGKGSSGTPPGQSRGKSGDAPGQNKSSLVSPGSSGNAPSQVTGTAGSSSVQGTDQ